MCKVCCLSLKSGCYFASSVHIVDALFLLWTFIFDVVHINKLGWYVPVQDDPYLTTYLALIGAYIIPSIILGCLIFRAIEEESPRFIGGCAGGFLILQVIAFIVTLCWWYPIPPLEDPFGLLESARIGRFVIRCLATVGYIAVLGIYMRDLHYKGRNTSDVFHAERHKMHPKF